jgi:hypothetical protein
MEPNFIIVPKPDPLHFLWSAFPEFRSIVDDEDVDLGSYYVYARFADHLSANREDGQLWQRVYALFELLATAHRDLLIDVLESLCQDQALAQRITSNAGPKAVRTLRAMKR